MYNDIHDGEFPRPSAPHGPWYMVPVDMDESVGEESNGGVWSGGKPSEEEQSSWEQQRQRREKLSSLMGQYLLKGYRMLGSNCSDCGTILLQTRDGINYCVQCSELTQDCTGASPEQLQEPPSLPTAMEFPTKADTDSNIIQNTPKLLSSSDDTDKTLSKPNFKDIRTDTPNTTMDLGIHQVEKALVAKLQWASGELATATSVEDSTQICLLIKACAEALKSVRELSSKPHTSVLKIRSDTNS